MLMLMLMFVYYDFIKDFVFKYDNYYFDVFVVI